MFKIDLVTIQIDCYITSDNRPGECSGEYYILLTVITDILSIQDRAVNINFIDSGIGIDPSRLSSLFNLDEHRSTKGTENEKGTGLGLIVTKEFVQLSGGNIHILSEAAKGTTVTISLPAFV